MPTAGAVAGTPGAAVLSIVVWQSLVWPGAHTVANGSEIGPSGAIYWPVVPRLRFLETLELGSAPVTPKLLPVWLGPPCDRLIEPEAPDMLTALVLVEFT